MRRAFHYLPCCVVILLLTLQLGCDSPATNNNYGGGEIGPFKDDAAANTDVATLEDFAGLQFVDLQGQPTDLAKYRGEKNVVLVITRGLTSTLDPNAKGQAGGICLFCAAQTSRIAANYAEFTKRNAEVVIVFPVVKASHQSRVVDFQAAVKSADSGKTKEFPMPLVFDPELKVVDKLGIRKDLSKPATYILDPKGQVQYAYVGATLADRPSVKAMLDQLDEMNQRAQ